MPLAPRTFPLHDHVLPLQTLLPRQDNATNVPSSIQDHSLHTKLPSWAIVIIVIGSLLVLTLLVAVGIRIRTHFVLKRGFSTTQVDQHFVDDGGNGFMARRGSEREAKRASVIEEAGTKIRRLIKKNRPSNLSRGMEMTNDPETKGGLEFGMGFGNGKKGRRKSHISTRLHSDDLSGAHNALGAGKGPFSLHGHTHSQSRSIVGTGSALTSIGREEDVERGRGQPFGMGLGAGNVAPARGRRSSDSWNYDAHSVAHTIRDSFDDPRAADTAFTSTSAPASTSSPFSPPTHSTSPFSPSSSYTSPFAQSPGKEDDSYLSAHSHFGYSRSPPGPKEDERGWGHERAPRPNRI